VRGGERREQRNLTVSSVAQVDISGHEVSPKPSPLSHSQKPAGGTGETGRRKETKVSSLYP